LLVGYVGYSPDVSNSLCLSMFNSSHLVAYTICIAFFTLHIISKQLYRKSTLQFEWFVIRGRPNWLSYVFVLNICLYVFHDCGNWCYYLKDFICATASPSASRQKKSVRRQNAPTPVIHRSLLWLVGFDQRGIGLLSDWLYSQWAFAALAHSVLWLVDCVVGWNRAVITDIHHQQRDNRATAVALSDVFKNQHYQGFKYITERRADMHCWWSCFKHWPRRNDSGVFRIIFSLKGKHWINMHIDAHWPLLFARTAR